MSILNSHNYSSLRDADLKYTNRESREEDVDTIQQLNAALEQYQADLSKYIVCFFKSHD